MSNLSPLGLTRDSLTLYVLALVAVAGYLSTMPVPTEWTYGQWLQAISAAGMYVVGKLQTSPLVGDRG